MTQRNKEILEKANTAITKGDYEGFLSFCSDDTKWIFVGDQILNGKEEVRKYMEETYLEPPKFKVENLIEGENFVTAIGQITLKDKNGKSTDYDYCDVWRFEGGKMVELRAFVVEKDGK